MGVVPAFTAIPGTDQAGMTAYYRAPGCNSVKIVDVLPILSKINHYEPEYVVGEMLIWNTGSQSAEPDNCTLVRIIVYNDGWVCAWFDKTTTNQLGIGGAQFVDKYILEGWGTSFEYENKWNSSHLKITSSTDPECPVDSIFTIRKTDHVNGQITVSNKMDTEAHFNSGYSYGADIYMTNGNLLWVGAYTSDIEVYPPENSNRLYRAIYQIWAVLKYSSNTTNIGETYIPNGYAWGYDDGIWTDNYLNYHYDYCYSWRPVGLVPSIGDGTYYGSDNKFNDIYINITTPGVGDAATWEYWNGSIWSVLSVTDGTVGLTQSGHITFIPSDNWEPIDVQGSTGYYIRCRCTAENWSVSPNALYARLYEQNDTSYLDTEFGLYNFQFTSANYVLMCGKYISHSSYSYFYYTILPSHIIYDNVLNIGNYQHYGNDEVEYNGVTVYDCSASYGHVTLPGSSISYTPGIQNVIQLHCNDYRSGIISTAIIIVS